MSRARVTLVAPLPEQVDPDLTGGRRTLLHRVGTGAITDRLEARFGTPFWTDTVLQGGAERVGDAHLLALAESGVEYQERLVPDLPSRGELRAGWQIGDKTFLVLNAGF